MKILSIILIMTFFLVNCMHQSGRKEYWEISKIPASEKDARLAKFSEYPVEKQIDIYLYDYYSFEGGNLDSLRYISLNGEGKMEAIAKRLDESKYIVDKTGLMRALYYIDKDCQCVAKNAQVLQILEKNEMQIDEDGFKEQYTEYLKEIKSGQNKWNL